MNFKEYPVLLDDQVAEITLSYSNRLKLKDRVKVTNPNIAGSIFRQTWNPDKLELQESFKVMLLNRNNQLLGIVNLSEGGIAGTVVDMKLLFAVVLKSLASGIILCHNHPSGNLCPSDSDLRLQRKVETNCSSLEISMLDHLILTYDGFYSFVNEKSFSFDTQETL